MLRDFVLKIGAVSALVLVTAVGCTKNSSPAALGSLPTSPASQPTVLKVENRAIASPAGAALKMENLKKARRARDSKNNVHAAFATPESPIISSQVTFDRAAILNQVFLYGSDLQYSSLGEEDGMLLQSIAIGHVTARFQILGNRLQLMAEEKYRFESDINIPLRLLFEWPIVQQNATQITVDISAASPAVGGILGEDAPGGVRSSWVRSVEFVPQGSYLMIESSIETANGKVAEFMESIFPRETLIAKAPSAIFDDPSLDERAGRFGFLSNAVWMTFPEGRTQTAVAQRFMPPAQGQTIDWYVTANIPAEFVPVVQAGVEGWNRYSQKMWGRDFVKFKGTLPAGVKLGDPRYNVINWDSVVDASSAYESQAADPETGIQSHSLIYLPYAWVKIGREFWERGQLTQDRTASLKASIDAAKFLGRKVAVPCFNEAELGAISLKMKENPDVFAKELLRGTLFHEVGHALGLAHNFKGSLEWNPDDSSAPFTASIMDYNHYDLEDGGFFDATGGDGPLLEYDRQIISALYNDGKDIAETDRVLPYCNDAVADSKAGGVDPLCIRYDSGFDPSVLLERTLKLIQDPASTLGKTTSLAKAAAKTISTLGDAANVKTEAEARMSEMILRTQVSALTQYYVSAGAQGLNYMLSANLRSLAIFKAGSLPSTVDALALRARIAATMDEVMALEQFSPATRSSFEKVGDDAIAWLKQTAWYATAVQTAQAERETAMRGAALEALQSVEKLVMPRVRTRQIAALARSTQAPYFFANGTDYELKALGWLETVLVKTLPSGASYTIGERVAAAQTLATFGTIPLASSIKVAARARTETDITKATTAEERESLRALLALL